MKAANISSTSTSVTRIFAWFSRRRRTSPHSAATRTTFNFRVGRWISRFSVLMRTTSRPRLPIICRSISPARSANQLVFVSGDPGTTARLQTRSQLEFARDVSLPTALLRAAELRGRYIQFGKNNAGDERITLAPLNNLQNSIKVRRKELDALNDAALLEEKSKAEQALRAVAAFTDSDPWQAIAAASSRERALYLPYIFIENAAGFSSALFRNARLLVRGADERLKPNRDRLREFSDSELPHIEHDLYAQVPVYPEFEQMTLSFSLERMREWLGPDHPVVRRLMSKESPDALATRLIAETELNDAAFRKRLWEGGRSAVYASRDPMIVLARTIDGDARAIRRQYEDEVEAPIAAAAERIAAARFEAYGVQPIRMRRLRCA